MITLCILSNFKGTTLETIKAAFICILLDSTYLLPAIYYNI
jgi:hypothetical protein